MSLDLQVVDLGAALDFARDKLKDLGAPRGSVLKFRKGEVVTTLPIG